MSTHKFIILGVGILGIVLSALFVDFLTRLFGGLGFSAEHDTDGTPVWSGVATWYGEGYRGRLMANGQPFDPDALTCACWLWPLGQILEVEGPDGHTVRVVVTDRGPDKRLGRLIDLSREAFKRIASLDDGKARVKVRRVDP